MADVKDDKYYLVKIKDDLGFMLEQMNNKTQKDFENNPLLIDSMMFRIVQIAENNEKLTETFKKANSDIPWKAIKGMRNRIVHDYGVIDLTKVYNTLIQSVPELYEIIKKYV